MKAELLRRERVQLASGAFVDMVVWRVAQPLAGSAHGYKYRLAYVVDGRCVLRYDNEAGKGDHRHVGEQEEPVTFTGIEALLDAFIREVERREGL